VGSGEGVGGLVEWICFWRFGKALLLEDLIMKHQLCESVMNELNDMLDRIGVDTPLGSSLIRTIVNLGKVYMYTVFPRPKSLKVDCYSSRQVACSVSHFLKVWREKQSVYSFK
jgi:hypothetical protein